MNKIFKKYVYFIIDKILKIYLFPIRIFRKTGLFVFNDANLSQSIKGALIEPSINIEFEQSDDPVSTEKHILDYFKKIKVIKKNSPTISVLFRCKNSSDTLFLSVSSFVPIATEIILVDNDSSDNTKIIFEELVKQFGDQVNFKIAEWPHKINMPGEGYKLQCEQNPIGSIAEYANFVQDLATCEYVFKADSHIILLPSAASKIQSYLSADIDALFFMGLCLYGRKLSYEPRLYKNFRFKNIDGEKWEYLSLGKNIKTRRLSETVFLHIKYLMYSKYYEKTLGWSEKYK